MENFSLDNIDLFYYHSTAIDITRLYSILKNGILSANEIKRKKIPYYHRNYIRASCKNDYISVSHFARTIFNHFGIKNELYDSSVNKVVFVLNGDIKAEDKHFFKRKYEYTKERHVYKKIEVSDINGVAIRSIYANRPLDEIPFTLNYSNEYDQIKKCFDVIKFLEVEHNYKPNSNIYELVGKYTESKVMNLENFKELRKELSNYMKNYIKDAYIEILGIENPTLIDVINLYNINNLPVYLMTKYDIQLYNNRDLLCKKNKYNETIKLLNKREEYLKQMRNSDKEIYDLFKSGPITSEGEKTLKKIKKIDNDIAMRKFMV